MYEGTKSQFDTKSTNEVTKHTTSLQKGEEFMRVCETRDNCEVLKKVGLVMPLMVLKIIYSLKDVKVWAITIVMSSMRVMMMISGDSMTSRNFILHYFFLSE
jgi:branched-subunit amino acid transport protein AzlD